MNSKGPTNQQASCRFEYQFRGVRGSVGAVFFQIYYRTDKDQFFHNWNQCTPPRVGFKTYSGVVFYGRFSQFGRFKILKKKPFFNIKKKNWSFKPNINISTCSRFQVNANCFYLFIYLASHQNLVTHKTEAKESQIKRKKKESKNAK